MPIDVLDVLDILSRLCDDARLRVTIKESVKSGAVAGASTTLGGILGGPVGVLVGGLIGVGAATYMAQGKFKPVSAVIGEMPESERQALYERAVAVLEGVGVEDLTLLGQMALGGDQSLRQQLLDIVVDTVSGQLKMEIVD